MIPISFPNEVAKALFQTRENMISAGDQIQIAPTALFLQFKGEQTPLLQPIPRCQRRADRYTETGGHSTQDDIWLIDLRHYMEGIRIHPDPLQIGIKALLGTGTGFPAQYGFPQQFPAKHSLLPHGAKSERICGNKYQLVPENRLVQKPLLVQSGTGKTKAHTSLFQQSVDLVAVPFPQAESASRMLPGKIGHQSRKQTLRWYR